VLALVEGDVCDPLQKLGVVLQGADIAPGDLVGRDTKWSSLSARSRVSMASISHLFATKGASASPFDFVVFFWVVDIILGSPSADLTST
jgi:hypothetical protein